MITGSPISRSQLELEMHLEPEEIAFTLQQEIVDEDNTEVTTSAIVCEGG